MWYAFRMNLKLGKSPARPDSITFRLRDYLVKGKLPLIPAVGGHDYAENWGMLGNDQYGDCVLAGAAHETMQWNRERGAAATFTPEAVLSDYSAITGFNPNDPNTDQGTDMQVAASYRRKTGVVDAAGTRHKIDAYLAVKTEAEIKAAVYLFGAAGVGIRFPKSAMDQFNAGKPWTIVKNSPIEGGHYIPALNFDKKYVYCVTWGKKIPVAWTFIKKYMDEGVVYISEEMLTSGKSPEGFNLAQLQADLALL